MNKEKFLAIQEALWEFYLIDVFTKEEWLAHCEVFYNENPDRFPQKRSKK